MKKYYKKDLKATYLILEGEEEGREDYQVAMLRGNEIPGVLKMRTRFVEDSIEYHYDISGKTSFKTHHEKLGLSYEQMYQLVNSLIDTMDVLQTYMLDANCLLLSPEYIFFDREQFYFCYYPFYKEDTKADFHQLTEFFVREVNYQDEEGVQFAYTLHKATMEENYSIVQIMEELQPEQKEVLCEEIEIPATPPTEDVPEEIIDAKPSIKESVRKFLGRTVLVNRT